MEYCWKYHTFIIHGCRLKRNTNHIIIVPLVKVITLLYNCSSVVHITSVRQYLAGISQLFTIKCPCLVGLYKKWCTVSNERDNYKKRIIALGIAFVKGQKDFCNNLCFLTVLQKNSLIVLEKCFLLCVRLTWHGGFFDIMRKVSLTRCWRWAYA